MRIGVLGDVHDNIWALRDALVRLQDCEQLLCLGDMCSPFVYKMILDGFPRPVHFVWGNNDGDRLLIVRNADKAGNATLHGDFAELKLGGRDIALVHYPQMANALAMGGQYDMVCCGHNHQRGANLVGRTLLLNPGEVMGRFGVHSVAIYDTVTGQAEIAEF